MKRLLLLLFSCVALSCSKTPLSPVDSNNVGTPPITSTVAPPIIELGKGSVVRNGKLWTPSFLIKQEKPPISTFWFNAKEEAKGVRQSMSIYNLPLKMGRHPIYFNTYAGWLKGVVSGAYFLMYDGDQPTGDYIIDTTRADHYVEIIRYDSVARTIEGRFQMFLVNDGKIKPLIRDVPAKVDFTDGKFHLQIKP